MSGFHVAWIAINGERHNSVRTFAQDTADEMVRLLNTTLPVTGRHVAVPEGKLEEWKAGTWKP